MTSDVAHVRSMYRGAVAPVIVLGLLTGGYVIVAGIAGLAGWTALLRDDFFKFSLLAAPFSLVLVVAARVMRGWLLSKVDPEGKG